MVKQAPVKGRKAVMVDFVLPQGAVPGEVSVVGDFNGWDPPGQSRARRDLPLTAPAQGSSLCR